MKVSELLEWINNNVRMKYVGHTKQNQIINEVLDFDVTIAFTHNGETVTSDIVSVCFNGNSIQLNEEDFYNHIHGEKVACDTESNTLNTKKESE
tara:strand:+ start:56 stop:337 length:282 start_codon:yes stop_codon:yes gene_type:complete